MLLIQSLAHQDHLLLEDAGVTGDITAARKVRVKIGGAMSMHEGAGVFDDNGFVIAHLERVLSLIDEAVAKANALAP